VHLEKDGPALFLLILPATSKGYSEDFLCKTDAATIVLTRRKDFTERLP
jgi:hypothetical protein